MDETKVKEAIASVLKDGGKRDALAELLVEYVNPNHITVDFISLLLNTRNMKPGDALVKKVRKGIDVRTWVPGSINLKSELTVSDRMNYILDAAIVGVTANEWELESGELGSVDSIKTEMQAKLRDYYLGKVFTALSTVWSATNTPDNYTNVGAALNATVLKAAIDKINQTVGGVKAVVGTRAALTPVTTFGAGWDGGNTDAFIVPENIREIMSTGWLGRYYGAPLLAINQIYDNPEDYNALIPEDKILVIGENVGEFITFGDVKSQEYTDMRVVPPQWYFSIYQQFGLIVDKAMGIYVLKVA